MKINEVRLDALVVGVRWRGVVDKAKVNVLADSMKAIGLQQPISVWFDDDDAMHLVAGLHRIRAAEKLGWEKIDAVTVDLNNLDRELWEIDENLIRAGLTELERAQHTARRAEIVKERFEFAKIAKTETDPSQNANKGQTEFVEQTAKATGKSKRSVAADKSRGEKITPETQKAIADMPAADTGVELDAIAALEPEEQQQAVERVQSGASKNFREARDFIQGDNDTSNVQTDYSTFRKKIGAPVHRSQQWRILDCESQILGIISRCETLEDVYIERLASRDYEAKLVTDLERAQRDLKRFLGRVKATYADSSGREPHSPDIAA